MRAGIYDNPLLKKNASIETQRDGSKRGTCFQNTAAVPPTPARHRLQNPQLRMPPNTPFTTSPVRWAAPIIRRCQVRGVRWRSRQREASEFRCLYPNPAHHFRRAGKNKTKCRERRTAKLSPCSANHSKGSAKTKVSTAQKKTRHALV